VSCGVRHLWRSPRLVAGLLMVGAAGAAALAGVFVAGDPFVPSQAILVGPSGPHPLGTDELGRDILARILHGAGTSLLVAFAAVLPATVFGTTLGLVSGYAGRFLDELILKAAELFQIIPAFLLALVAGALLGPSLLLLIVVLNIIFWPFTARLARGEAAALREREFVEAARALGASRLRILRRHVLPGVLAPVIVNASFQAGVAMLVEAGLAFLGLGDANVVSWGQMLADAQEYLGVAWWLYVLPGAALAFTILGMNLTGDGLNQLRSGADVARPARRRGRAEAAPAEGLGELRDGGEPIRRARVTERALLEVRGLTTRFGLGGEALRVVDGVSFELRAGQRFGIVGESGSGKTVTALSIMGLVDPPGRVEAGEIWLNGRDLRRLSEREYRAVRGARVAMIFQDPLSSLNPVIRVGDQLAETIAMHRQVSRRESRELAVAFLCDVGIPAARERFGAYPHELSGGMRQRVGIALALCCEPDVLIADEPTTALDVTIQAQILDLLRKLTDDQGTAVILITHDLAVIAGFAEEVAVMYAGRVVERADVDTLFARPAHPYTQSLLASVSRLDGPSHAGRFTGEAAP